MAGTFTIGETKVRPGAYHHYENLITLPLHTRLSDEDAAYVTEQFADIVKEYLR